MEASRSTYAPPVAVGARRSRDVSLPRPAWPVIAGLAVTLLAAVLRLTSIEQMGSNPFYDAAVRSMGLSWHNFFFAAFDPAGRLAIDKPPVDLWLQVASVKLFGQSRAALTLPQALAGTAAVPLLFDTVRRVAGSAAALVAALALALMPLSVETARSDTMDSLMAALCLLAAWLAVRAAQTGRARWIYAAAVVMGTSFEVKLFEGLLALPAIAVLYAVAAPHPWRRRLVHGAIAGGLFLVAALWWPLAVSLASPASRPWAIGSTDGSVLSAIFYYNGTQRLSPIGAKATGIDGPGLLRLFRFGGGGHYGESIGVELVAALAFGGAALVLALLAWRRRGPSRLALGAGLAAAVWIGVCFAVFSSMQSVLHLRYLEAMTAPVAAVLGVGLVACARACVRRGGVAAPLLTAAAALGTVLYAAAGDPAMRPVVLAAAGVACVAAFGWAVLRTGLVSGARVPVAAGLVIALACSAATLTIPAKRVQFIVGAHANDAGAPGAHAEPVAVRAHRFLATHAQHDRYDLVVASYLPAAELIVHHSRPLVLSAVGRRTVVSTAELRRIVRRGLVHYALVGGRCGRARPATLAGCPRVFRWIREHSVDVSRSAGFPDRGELFRFAA